MPSIKTHSVTACPGPSPTSELPRVQRRCVSFSSWRTRLCNPGTSFWPALTDTLSCMLAGTQRSKRDRMDSNRRANVLTCKITRTGLRNSRSFNTKSVAFCCHERRLWGGGWAGGAAQGWSCHVPTPLPMPRHPRYCPSRTAHTRTGAGPSCHPLYPCCGRRSKSLYAVELRNLC